MTYINQVGKENEFILNGSLILSIPCQDEFISKGGPSKRVHTSPNVDEFIPDPYVDRLISIATKIVTKYAKAPQGKIEELINKSDRSD